MVGKQILHYKVLEELGRGGMGVVYKAEDTKLKRIVAIKFLPRQIAVSHEERERFKIEAQAAAALNHPNIATIHAIEEIGDEMFIVMEYIDGRELKDVITDVGAKQSEQISENKSAGLPGNASPLHMPTNQIINIATQIAEGLQAAHEHGIVHRDIKSANIMVTDKGVVKIMDFGLAKIGGGAQLTKDQSTLGTAAYMSPEQVRGEDADSRTDIWAFGVVLYEMLTGQLPFRGDYEQAVIYAILNEEPESPDELRSDVSGELETLVNRMLAKTRSDRFGRIGEVLSELNALQGSTPSAAEIMGSRHKGRINKRQRWILTAMAASLILLFLVLYNRESGPDLAQQASSASNNAIAVLPFSVRGNTELDYLGQGMVDLLSTKLDGAGGWRSVDPRAILGFVERYPDKIIDPENGRIIAQRLDARFYVLGNILEISGRLQLNASLYDLDRGQNAVAEATAEGEAAQLFRLVDEVASRLMISRGHKSESRIDRIEAVTTSSLPALKAYIEGETAFRRGQYQPAVDAFQRAVAEDKSFALAYYRLSIAAEWHTMSELSFKATQQALRLTDRLSERDRRLFRAFLAYRQGKAAEAERLYRTIIDAYPDDVEALLQLAEVLFHYNPLHGRSFTESEEIFKRVLYYEPDDAASLIHLVRIAAYQGRVEEMNMYVQRTLELIPEGDRTLELKSLQAVATNSQRELDQLMTPLKTAGEIQLIQSIYIPIVYSNNFQRVKQMMFLLTSSTRSFEVRALGHAWKAYLHVAAGEWQSAKIELTAMQSSDPIAALENYALLSLLPFLKVPDNELREILQQLEQVNSEDKMPGNRSLYLNMHDDIHSILNSYLLGQLNARLGDSDAAIAHTAGLEQIEAPPSGGTIATDLALSIRSQVKMNSGQFDQALAELEQTRIETWYHKVLASPFYAQTNERFMRAELLRKLGRDREALAWYESLPEITPYGLVYLAISHFRRAEIYETMGEKEQAISHYSRFIEVWRNGDPELQPSVEDARKRVAYLRSKL